MIVMENPDNRLTVQRRIAFSDTDAAGLIHFSTYFKLMEEAEAELFRTLEIPLLSSDSEGIAGFPRVDCSCKFRMPLRFDDLVLIELGISSIRATRVSYTFVFYSAGGDVCAEGTMVTAYVSGKHGARLTASGIPDNIRNALESWKYREC